MSRLLKVFLAGLIVLAILPFLPAFLAGSPLLILLIFFFGFKHLKGLWGGTWKMSGDIISASLTFISAIFKGVVAILGWLFVGRSKRNSFMGSWQQFKLLGPHQDGFLVDGHKKRLSETSTYESLLIQGGMGRGKSSTFVMPNLLNLPRHNPSFVITDTSGEIFQNTAGHLAREGYQIKCLDLINLSNSETYNPLASCQSPKDIAELAKILISTGSQKNGGKSSDPFWEQSAEKLIRIFAQCLQNQVDPQYRNLANLRHLITSFDAHIAPKGQLSKIDRFVLSSTQNDPTTFSSYQAFIQGNLKTIQSVLMSADVALDAIGIPEIAALTSTNSFQMSELRNSPTALYILVNQTQMPYFSFILNLYYTDLFKTLLTNHHNPGRPVWLFLEEFGQFSVNNFEVYSSTARKYKVSFAMFLQSLAQLEARYGAINAKTILDSIGTEIYLPGMALDTARNLEARIGRVKNSPLMPANEIIRMNEKEALMLQSNHLPIKLKTKRFYQQRNLQGRSSVPFNPPSPGPKTAPKLMPL